MPFARRFDQIVRRFVMKAIPGPPSRTSFCPYSVRAALQKRMSWRRRVLFAAAKAALSPVTEAEK